MCSCNGTGIIKVVSSSMAYTNACTCEVARENREKVDRELRELLEQSKRRKGEEIA